MRAWRCLSFLASLVALASSVWSDDAPWAGEIDELVSSLVRDADVNRGHARARIEFLVSRFGQPALDRLEAAIRKRGGGEQLDAIVQRHGVSVIRWGVQTGASTRPPSLATNGKYVAGASEAGLHVLDAETGAWLWGKEGSFERRVPGFYEDLLIAHLPPDSVAAYRARDGSVVWAHSLADLGGDAGRERTVTRIQAGKAERARVVIPPRSLSDAAIRTILIPSTRCLVCATRTGHVVCLSVDGKRLWVAPPPNAGEGAARIVCDAEAGTVLVTYPQSGGVIALSLADGTRRWASVVDGQRAQDPIVNERRLVIAAAPVIEGKLDGRLECLDVRTGKRLWGCQVSKLPDDVLRKDKRRVSHGAVVAEEGLVGRPGVETTVARLSLGRNGALCVAETRLVRFGVRLTDGSVRWAIPRGEAEAFAGPERDGGLLGSSTGTLLLMDAAKGTIVRKVDLVALGASEFVRELVLEKEGSDAVRTIGRLGRPVVDGERCFLSTETGGVLCLRIPPLIAQREKP